MSQPFFVYMLRYADGSYYVGHTDDLERRLAEHRQGRKCSYTNSRRPIHLCWSQEFASREEVLQAEVRIKSWSRTKKEALMSGDFAALRRAARKEDWVAYRERRKRS